MSLVKRILIANRGEIACRIIRTAKRYNIHHLGWGFSLSQSIVILTEILSLQIWLIRPIGLGLTLQVSFPLFSSKLFKFFKNLRNSSRFQMLSPASRVRIFVRKCILCLIMLKKWCNIHWTTVICDCQHGKQKRVKKNYDCSKCSCCPWIS